MRDEKINRRDFVKAATLAGTGLLFVKPESVYGTPANNAVSLGIIGCGGRGNYIGREMIGNAEARVVALHDLFEDRLLETRDRFNKLSEERNHPKISDALLFKGADAYHKLLASGVDAVIITSPPYFHPDHFEAAVQANKHCYLEKPVATDVYGTKRIERTGRKGDGKVSMAVGFQSRYAEPYQEMMRRIHAGAIGDLVCAQTYYYTGDLPRKARPGMSAQEARIRNWVFDKVLSGDILVEQNIHVLDIVNWALRSHPVKAQGTGGRKARMDVECWDHFVMQYVYPGDVHVSFNSTQFKRSYDSRTQRFLGSKGYAEASFGKGGVRIVGEEPWDPNVGEGFGSAVPRKVKAFVESVRSGNFLNEIPSSVESTLTVILGRTAAYAGREMTWDEVVRSDERWDGKLDLEKI